MKLITRAARDREDPLSLNAETWSPADRTSNELFHERSPAVVCQLHVNAITSSKNYSAHFVQPLQTNRIIQIQFLHPHWNDLLFPREGFVRGGIRSEPRTFLGYDCYVFGEEHENKLVQRRQVLSVRRVVCIGDFVVDVREELIVGEVKIYTVWISVVLRLYRKQQSVHEEIEAREE